MKTFNQVLENRQTSKTGKRTGAGLNNREEFYRSILCRRSGNPKYTRSGPVSKHIRPTALPRL